MNLEKVLKLVNLARTARGLLRVNQYANVRQIDVQTATLVDLLLPESLSHEAVTFRTKKDAKAVARAWMEALPDEYPPNYASSFQGFIVRLPLILQQFIRDQEAQGK